MDMSRSRVVAHYRNLLRQFGPSPAAMGWPDVARQVRRFEVLLGGLDGHGSLLDYGCGFGDLAPHWPGEYIGYDLTPEMLEQARQKYPGKRFVASPAPADWVVASGVFNLELGVDLTWRSIEEMWSLAGRGIAFNLLVDARGRGIHVYDMQDVLARCRRLTPAPAALRHAVGDPAGDLAVWCCRRSAIAESLERSGNRHAPERCRECRGRP